MSINLAKIFLRHVSGNLRPEILITKRYFCVHGWEQSMFLRHGFFILRSRGTIHFQWNSHYSRDKWKLASEFVESENRLRLSRKIPKKRMKTGRPTLPKSRLHGMRAMVIKTVWYYGKENLIIWWIRTQRTEINTRVQSTTFTKAKAFSGQGPAFSKWCWPTRHSDYTKVKGVRQRT